MIELLKYLKENKYKIAIATSSRKRKLEIYLNAANIDIDIFDVIITRDSNIIGKPNPDIYKKTIEELNVKPNEVIVLEDSINGIISAKGAEAIACMIPDLFEPTKEQMKLIDYKLKNLYDVIKLLEKEQKWKNG